MFASFPNRGPGLIQFFAALFHSSSCLLLCPPLPLCGFPWSQFRETKFTFFPQPTKRAGGGCAPRGRPVEEYPGVGVVCPPDADPTRPNGADGQPPTTRLGLLLRTSPSRGSPLHGASGRCSTLPSCQSSLVATCFPPAPQQLHSSVDWTATEHSLA